VREVRSQKSKVKSQKSKVKGQKSKVKGLRVGGLGLGFALALVFAGFVVAQPGGGRHGPPSANRKLEALRIWRLTQELDLNEDQAAAFFPKLKAMRGLRHEHRMVRRALLDELGERLAEDPVDPARLTPVLDSLVIIEDNLREAELELRQEINAILTIEQQARLYVFEASFDRQARRVISEIREDRDKPGGRR